MKNRLAIIIPTVNRTDYLRRLLESVKGQSALPEEVIIVDGGPADISGGLADFKDFMNIRYVVARPASLTRQRNTGISNVSGGITLVGFIDDDIVLEKDALKNMLAFWETASASTGGASFNNISDNFRKAGLMERMFFVNCSQSGRLFKSGFNSKICSIERTKAVDWLYGGITVWRREIVDNFKFDEWFTGNAYCDDLDYSFRVGKRYKLMVVKEARVQHLGGPVPVGSEYFLGKAIVRNKIYFVRKNPGFSLLLCYWGCIGICLGNAIKGMVYPGQRRRLRRAHGNIAGLRGA